MKRERVRRWKVNGYAGPLKIGRWDVIAVYEDAGLMFFMQGLPRERRQLWVMLPLRWVQVMQSATFSSDVLVSNNFWGSAVCVATALDMHGEYLGPAAYVQIDGEHSFGSCGGAERDVGYSIVSVTRAAGFSIATRSLGDALSADVIEGGFVDPNIVVTLREGVQRPCSAGGLSTGCNQKGTTPLLRCVDATLSNHTGLTVWRVSSAGGGPDTFDDCAHTAFANSEVFGVVDVRGAQPGCEAFAISEVGAARFDAAGFDAETCSSGIPTSKDSQDSAMAVGAAFDIPVECFSLAACVHIADEQPEITA